MFVEWEGFSQATGIGDIRGWARQHASSSIEFTLQMLKTPHQNVVQCLLKTWRSALAIEPKLLEEVPFSQRHDLLSALHGRFQACGAWDTTTQEAFGAAAKAITGGVTPSTLTDNKMPLTPDQLQMAVELALVPTPISPKVIQSVMARVEELSDATLLRIEWCCQVQMKALTPNTALGPLMAFARSRRLERAFDSGESAPAASPRF